MRLFCLQNYKSKLPAWSAEASGTGIASNAVPPDPPPDSHFVGCAAWISGLQRKAMEKKKTLQCQQTKLHPPELKEPLAAAFHKNGFYQGVRMEWNHVGLQVYTLFHLLKATHLLESLLLCSHQIVGILFNNAKHYQWGSQSQFTKCFYTAHQSVEKHPSMRLI